MNDMILQNMDICRPLARCPNIGNPEDFVFFVLANDFLLSEIDVYV